MIIFSRCRGNFVPDLATMRTFLFSILFFSISAQAQVSSDSIKTVSIDEVVVTASRTPRLLGNVAVPVTLVSAKSIYQSGSLRLHDILAEQTGLVLTDNFGKGIQVQGLSSDYTLILIDGEPLIGRTGGVLDLSRISIRNIRKIEVIKGPSSSLYGSEAMGGVINIITDRSGQNKADASLRYGRFNTIDGAFNFSRRIGKTGVQGSINHNRSEGYSLKPNSIQQTVEPYRRGMQQVSIHHELKPHWKLGAGFRHNSTYTDNSIAVQNGAATIVSRGYEKSNEYNITPYIQHQFNERVKTLFRGYLTGFTAIQELRVKDVLGAYDDRFKQGFRRIENQTDWQIRDQSSFIVGAGAIAESVSSNRYDSLSTLRKNSIAYFFLQHEEKINKKITLVGGLRYDANQAYASVWSPKAALQYKINEQLSFNLSYGRGFKAPDFRQLYLNFTNLAAGSYTVFGTALAAAELESLTQAGLIDQTTNMAARLADLKPEVSGGWNAGFKYRTKNGFSTSVNLFRNDIRNMIVTDIIAYKKSGGQIFSYFNLNSALTQGVEVDAEKKLSKQLLVRGGYQFLYAVDKDVLAAIKAGAYFQRAMQTNMVSRMRPSDYGGLPNRSRHNANLKFTYERESGFFATLRALYRSRWGTSDADGNGIINRAEDEFAAGYVQFNVSAGFSLGDRWKLLGGVDNLLNYRDVEFLPGNPGRMGYIDLQFNF